MELEEIKKKMQRLLNQGRNDENLNEKYRKALKDANHYENQFKPKDYGHNKM